MDGWVKIYRKMLEWEWYSDTNTKIVFLHCLLKANHADLKYHGEIVKRGTFLTSYATLAKELKISVKSVRVSVNHLKTTNELAIVSSPKGSVITVKNYDKYQTEGKPNGKRGAKQGQSEGKRGATNKNKDKNDKNVKKKDFMSVPDSKPKNPYYDDDDEYRDKPGPIIDDATGKVIHSAADL